MGGYFLSVMLTVCLAQETIDRLSKGLETALNPTTLRLDMPLLRVSDE